MSRPSLALGLLSLLCACKATPPGGAPGDGSPTDEPLPETGGESGTPSQDPTGHTGHTGSAPVEGACDDGVDDDGDGATDCADRDCVEQEACDGWGHEWAHPDAVRLNFGTPVAGGALAIQPSTLGLLIGGSFDNFAGAPGGVVVWDGDHAVPLVEGWQDGVVRAIHEAPDGTVYLGGQEIQVNGRRLGGLVAIDPVTRAASAPGGGVQGDVYAVTSMPDGTVYVGGDFQLAGGLLANNVAAWDGAAWSPLDTSAPGTDLAVDALVAVGDRVFAAGSFVRAGPLEVNQLAVWDHAASSWGTMGTGVGPAGLCGPSGDVGTMSTDGTGVLVGGCFTSMDGVALTGGAAVYQVATGRWRDVEAPPNVVASTVMPSGEILFGGQPTAWGERPRLYRLGATLEAHPCELGPNGGFTTLAVGGAGEIYAGGSFQSPDVEGLGPVGLNGFFALATWSDACRALPGAGPLRDQIDDPVSVPALALAPPRVVLGGTFLRLAAQRSDHLAAWNTATRQVEPFAENPDGPVTAAAAGPGGTLAVAGDFDHVGSTRAPGLAFFDGSGWRSLGAPDGEVAALATDGQGRWYAGGTFTRIGETAARGIAVHDGTGWRPLGDGVDGDVKALAVAPDGRVVVGGAFTGAGGAPADRVALWDPAAGTWSALGGGVGGVVRALALSGDRVYVGGEFLTAGGAPASHVAVWDASAGAWSGLGAGTDDTVDALAVHGDTVYAGGVFRAAGGGRATYVARWDGAAWWPLGQGTDGPALALAVDPSTGELWVTGDFRKAGGHFSYGVGRWTPPG